MVEAVSAEQLEAKTGYRTLFEALDSAKQRKDGRAIRFCLEMVRPMVNGLVLQYVRVAEQKRMTSMMAREDLEQVAFEHIIRAIDRFVPPATSAADDVECRKAWNRYASMVVKSPVRDAYAQSLGPVNIPDWALKIASKLNKAIREHEQDQAVRVATGESASGLGRKPDPRLIAAKAGVEYSKVKRFIDNGLHLLPAERFDYSFQNDEVTVAGLRRNHGGNHTADPVLQLSEGQEALLAEGLQLLNTREQYVIKRLYGLEGARPASYRQVAKALDLEDHHVRALERAAMSQLKAAFMEEDIMA